MARRRNPCELCQSLGRSLCAQVSWNAIRRMARRRNFCKRCQAWADPCVLKLAGIQLDEWRVVGISAIPGRAQTDPLAGMQFDEWRVVGVLAS